VGDDIIYQLVLPRSVDGRGDGSVGSVFHG
jgi:hypothetical protein